MSKKTYTVTAHTGYAGHQYGDVVELDLDELTEKRAVDRGSLKPGKHTTKKEKGED